MCTPTKKNNTSQKIDKFHHLINNPQIVKNTLQQKTIDWINYRICMMKSKLKIISQSIQNNIIKSIIILILIMLILIKAINISMINLIIVVWDWLKQVGKCNHLLKEQLNILTDKPHNLINEVNIHQN